MFRFYSPSEVESVAPMIVDARYHLPKKVVNELRAKPPPWGFGPLSAAVYFRTYSRVREDGKQEDWADTVIRVVEGTMSIRKDWLTRVIGKKWQTRTMDRVAATMAHQIFDMKFLPPGRGLWAMGTDYIYERGSHALQNCGAVEVKRSLSSSAGWLMDALMCGVGVGFSTHNASIKLKGPRGRPTTYRVPDSKEGWTESIVKLIRSYERGTGPVKFDYSLIRPAGAPIRGFGGTSSGYGPLEKLHQRLRWYLDERKDGEISDTRLVADVMNAIGACVVAGNVRRSAEIALGAPSDSDFLNLKNYDMYPERAEIGWMSNNSVVLRSRDDFHNLPELAPLIAENGEPGVINLLNIKKYGRASERIPDNATLMNPCAEQPLASHETCCLVEVFPTRCTDKEFADVLRGATFYASTVALLKSHSPKTNAIASQNRRIGVSVSGIADWIDGTSVAHVFDRLNHGYDVVKDYNKKLAKQAGVAESIRVTTVKPSGTISLLAGVSPGVHYPVGGYVLRRMRVAKDSPVAAILAGAGVPIEDDVASENTSVLEFPMKYGANGNGTRPVYQVSAYEQAAVAAMLQRCWSDNAVSCTVTVEGDELDEIGKILALFVPQVKSLSMLPATDGGAYLQMPMEAIDKAKHDELASRIEAVDWSQLHGSEGTDQAFCNNDTCDL